MKIFEGTLDGKDCSIGIVVSKFNEIVTSRLLSGAEETLKQLGTAAEQIQLVRVPGAFELPIAAKALAQSHEVDAIICWNRHGHESRVIVKTQIGEGWLYEIVSLKTPFL